MAYPNMPKTHIRWTLYLRPGAGLKQYFEVCVKRLLPWNKDPHFVWRPRSRRSRFRRRRFGSGFARLVCASTTPSSMLMQPSSPSSGRLRKRQPHWILSGWIRFGLPSFLFQTESGQIAFLQPPTFREVTLDLQTGLRPQNGLSGRPGVRDKTKTIRSGEYRTSLLFQYVSVFLTVFLVDGAIPSSFSLYRAIFVQKVSSMVGSCIASPRLQRNIMHKMLYLSQPSLGFFPWSCITRIVFAPQEFCP